jgi:hypothetical protein
MALFQRCHPEARNRGPQRAPLLRVLGWGGRGICTYLCAARLNPPVAQVVPPQSGGRPEAFQFHRERLQRFSTAEWQHRPEKEIHRINEVQSIRPQLIPLKLHRLRGYPRFLTQGFYYYLYPIVKTR